MAATDSSKINFGLLLNKTEDNYMSKRSQRRLTTISVGLAMALTANLASAADIGPLPPLKIDKAK
ncbi:secreted protein [Candidatus Thiomargarita nelsonii]|uniref:Secreted protein n=1 Tax=Candidatus Thiomargarita nelsonii TaxID=1003181 RepID=A0A176S1A6_9GAMM|nr:secreted protein [Candidatus Thiomargarita nelsonii]